MKSKLRRFVHLGTGDIQTITAGGQAAQGPPGPAGPAGQSSSVWNYKADTSTTTGPPGAGDLVWDNATQTSATNLIVDVLTSDSLDITNYLSLLVSGQDLLVQDANASANFQKWTISGTPTYTGGGDPYYTIPVTLISSGGTGTTGFANNHQLFIGVITPAGASGMTKISQTVTAGSQATVTLSSIPQTYNGLLILVWGGDTSAGVSQSNFFMLFNGDTTAANYGAAQNQVVNAGTGATSQIAATTAGVAIGQLPGTSANANSSAATQITIPNYASTSFEKHAIGLSSGGYPSYEGVRTFVWHSTAAITSITFTAGGTAFRNGSVVTLYGLG